MRIFTPGPRARHALIGAALALLPLAAAADIVRVGEFIDVTNHRGGNVIEMVQTRAQLERSGRTVRIRGYCRSACTMLVTMPNACLGPNAVLGFHAPRLPNTKIIPPYVPEIMAQFYRGGIRKKWNESWSRSLEMHRISARDYIKLDPQARICDSLRK